MVSEETPTSQTVNRLEVVCLRIGPASTGGKDDNDRSLIDFPQHTLMDSQNTNSLSHVHCFHKDH
jgi:hypothetical protein